MTEQEKERAKELEEQMKKAKGKTTAELLEDCVEFDDRSIQQLAALGELANRPPFNNIRHANLDVVERMEQLEVYMADHKHARDGSACMKIHVTD